jgi:hypothetical protein
MAYRDPYTSHNPQGYAAQSDQTLYNPYTEYQPHASYEPQAANPAYGAGQTYQGYQDEPFNPPRQSGYDTGAAPANTGFRQADGTYEKGADGLATPVTPARVKDTSAAGVRAWRYDHQGNLWSKGGRGSCIGRFCCCFIFSFIFILISVVLTLALFIRPPNIVINGVAPPTNGSQVQITQDPALQLNLLVNISVNNPNYFDVAFSSVDLGITYPIDNTDFGGGHASDVVFKSRSYREFDFPFAVKYKPADDPSKKILLDLVSKCLGDKRQNLTINYKISLGLKILVATIRPSVSNQFKFLCPDMKDQLTALLKGAGLNIDPNDIASVVGGS